MHESYEFALDELPIGPVRRAALLIGFDHYERQVTVVLDSQSGEFRRVPLMSPPRGWDVLALTPDGTSLLLRDRPDPASPVHLCRYKLATEHRRWIKTAGEAATWAAQSPTADHIGVLGFDDDPAIDDDWANPPYASRARIDLIDPHTNEQRLLWMETGQSSAECAIAWSPDGALIAATYFDPYRDDDATVVIDLDGTVRQQVHGAMIPQSPNAAWLSNRELVHWGHGLTILNIDDGTSRVSNERGAVWAVIGDRVVQSPDISGTEPPRLITTNLDGTDERPFVIVHPRIPIIRFDIAPAATQP